MLDWWLEILSDMTWCRRQWSAQGQKILNSLLLSLWVQQNWQSPPPNLPPHNFQRHSSFEDDQHNLTFDLLEKSPSSLLNKDHFRSFLSLLIYFVHIKRLTLNLDRSRGLTVKEHLQIPPEIKTLSDHLFRHGHYSCRHSILQNVLVYSKLPSRRRLTRAFDRNWRQNPNFTNSVTVTWCELK